MQSLELGSDEGRAAALRYLNSEHVVQAMTESNDLEALRKTIERMSLGRKFDGDVPPARSNSPATGKALKAKRRVAPVPGSCADLGGRCYRLGSPGVVSSLEAKKKSEAHFTNQKLAGAAVGVVPKLQLDARRWRSMS